MQKVASSHNQTESLTPANSLYREWIFRYTTLELKSDMGSSGDITSKQFFPAKKAATAKIISRQEGIVAGQKEIEYFLTQAPARFRPGLGKFFLVFRKKDGEKIARGETLCTLRADIRDILKIERVTLNLLGRMCGIATLTRRIVKKARAANPHVLIVPTRKTLWGLLDKRACSIGGGGTHRLNLASAVLIKDNHLDAVGRNISSVLRRFFPIKGSPSFIEIEVENAKEALTAAEEFCRLQGGISSRFGLPCFVMLDNVSPKELKKALTLLEKNRLRKHIGVEVSGGITEKNIRAYANTGVDVISMGMLTHSAPMLDLSLEVTSQ